MSAEEQDSTRPEDAPRPPEPVASYLELVWRGDTDGFLEAFTDDGVVDDWGRELHGRDAIRAWSDREFIGSYPTLRITGVRDAPDGVVVVGDWRSSHANGMSEFTFTLAGDAIARMTIRASPQDRSRGGARWPAGSPERPSGCATPRWRCSSSAMLEPGWA